MSKSSNLKQGIKSIIKRADVAVSYRAVSYRGTIKKALRWKTSEKGNKMHGWRQIPTSY